MNFSFNSNMPGFKVKRQKFGIGTLILLLFIGAAFLVSGLLLLKTAQIDPDWTRTQGTIIDASSSISDGSTLYTPVVQYEVNGQTYKITGGSSSSAYPNIGGQKEIAYNPTRPGQAKAVEGAGTKAFIGLFPLVGVVMIVLAPILFIRSHNRSKKINNLMQTGQKLQGVLVDVQSTGSNENTSYKIVVSAKAPDGSVQNYVSDSLNGIAGLAMADFRNSPVPIDVYIDPVDPQNYYVDISDIPNLTPERIGELIKSATTSNQPQAIVNAQPPPAENPPFPPITKAD